jgi:hypothetical protein
MLLTEARQALAIGDSRAAMVARRYVGKRFMLDREGPPNTAQIAEPVLFYEPIDPAGT